MVLTVRPGTPGPAEGPMRHGHTLKFTRYNVMDKLMGSEAIALEKSTGPLWAARLRGGGARMSHSPASSMSDNIMFTITNFTSLLLNSIRYISGITFGAHIDNTKT